MSSKRNASMITGISSCQSTCRILGQVSLNLLYWKKTSKRIYVVPGEINKKPADIQARSFMARALGEYGKECQAERGSKSGHMKSSTLKTHENCEGSISLTRRTRNLRRPSRMHVRNWKHTWLLLCPAKLSRAIKIVGVAHPIKTKQNLRVFWKPVNLQDCVWENHCRLIMKTILQEKETIHCSITIWFRNLVVYVKPCKFPQQRQQWTRNGKNWKNFGVEPDKSQK